MNIALWVLQALLAVLFLLAGIPKTFQPIETLAKRLPWATEVPAALVRFIGICEILAPIGLIVPPLIRFLPGLAIAAAIGLVLVMISAAAFHASRKEYSSIGFNAVLLILALAVAVGRFTVSPF